MRIFTRTRKPSSSTVRMASSIGPTLPPDPDAHLREAEKAEVVSRVSYGAHSFFLTFFYMDV